MDLKGVGSYFISFFKITKNIQIQGMDALRKELSVRSFNSLVSFNRNFKDNDNNFKGVTWVTTYFKIT